MARVTGGQTGRVSSTASVKWRGQRAGLVGSEEANVVGVFRENTDNRKSGQETGQHRGNLGRVVQARQRARGGATSPASRRHCRAREAPAAAASPPFLWPPPSLVGEAARERPGRSQVWSPAGTSHAPPPPAFPLYFSPWDLPPSQPSCSRSLLPCVSLCTRGHTRSHAATHAHAPTRLPT